MKNTTIIVTLLITVFFSACKYKDGGLVGNSKHRIERSWMLENYKVNGIDSTDAKMAVGFDETVFTLFKGEKAIWGNYRNSFCIGTRDNKCMYGSIDGTCPGTKNCKKDYWDIDKMNKVLQFLDGNFLVSYRTGAYAYNGSGELLWLAWGIPRMEILKLTKEQLWLHGYNNGNEYEIHLKAYTNEK